MTRWMLPGLLCALPTLAWGAPEPFANLADHPGAQGLVLSGQLFTGYEANLPDTDARFTEFVLERAELGARYGDAMAGMELRVEAVRALSPGSLGGVDGDSLVLRLRRAWGHVGFDTGPVAWTMAGGLVPDPWIAGVESQYHLRGTGPLVAERGGFFNHSDLGALLVAQSWRGRATVVFSVTNGEGRNEREQNDGKDLGVYAQLELLELEVFDAPLVVALHGVYRNGSVGISRVKNDRAGAAMTLNHGLYGLGAAAQAADGYLGRSEQSATGIDVWADARLWPTWLGVMAHWSSLSVAPEAADDASRQRLTAGVFADLGAWTGRLDRLRLYALYGRDTATDEGAPLPGVPSAYDAHRLMLRLEVRARTPAVGHSF
jgi:hypothetical protein